MRIVTTICSLALLGSMALLIVGCGSGPVRHHSSGSLPTSEPSHAYAPDAIPRSEPRSRYGNPVSYEQFGKRYYTMQTSNGFVDQGIASWYGKKFHGRRASNGETYDMYKMTAAHKTLPLPSYVEVTNLRNGRQIVVRVNDRGPFHQNRIIDLSYAAALKLDIVKEGTGMVEVRAIDPDNPLAHKGSQQKVVTKQPQRSIPGTSTEPVKSSVLAASSVTIEPIEEDVPVTAGISGISRPVESGPSSPAAQVNNPSSTTSIQTASSQPESLPQQLFVQLGAFSDKTNAERLRNQSQSIINRDVFVVAEQNQGQLLYKVRVGPLEDVDSTDAVVSDLNSAGLHEHKIVFQ